MTDRGGAEADREIIAEKTRVKAYVFLALAIAGVILAAVGVFLFIKINFNAADFGLRAVMICLTAVGAVMLIVFGGLFVRQLFRPYSLIVLKDGVLFFPDGTECKPSEILKIERSKGFGNCGKLTVTFADRKCEIDGVAKYEKAYRKLSVLAGKQADN